MSRDRITQLVGGVVLIFSLGLSAQLLPAIERQTEDHALRYTDVAVEGAPPFVAIGTMIGALRGLIVDYLWIKVQWMKEKGLFYELMADAELITKLQPRFAAVWAFLGHNMAYNISVATHTEAERWEWVRSGIDLVRREGLRYNPNDLVLYKELSFWFAHKIDGYTDDAHGYYKREFAREWHFLLGEPPDDYEARLEWIGEIADAADTMEEAEARAPGVRDLADRIRREIGALSPDGDFDVETDLVLLYGEWSSLASSPIAQLLGTRDAFREQNPVAESFDRILAEVEDTEQWSVLISHLRRRVLIERYNMMPETMREFTAELGPIDWRHPQAHALYWSRLGSRVAERRQANDDDVYKILNNDRVQLQSMQGLARYGRINFDPLSDEIPTRMPDRRWIDAIIPEFERLYVKHYNTRGAGGESFIGFLENFTSSAIREMYRMGYRAKAQELMDLLDQYFGRGAEIPSNKYAIDLETFTWRQTLDEYQYQPHLAQSDLYASLHNGFLNGIVYDQPEVLAEAREFAQRVTDFYESNNDFRSKLGTKRMGELVDTLATMELGVVSTIMIDRSIEPQQRMLFWSRLDDFYPGLRPWIYDRVRPQLEMELATTPWGQEYTIDEMLPTPPGLEIIREQIANDYEGARRRMNELRSRATIARQ